MTMTTQSDPVDYAEPLTSAAGELGLNLDKELDSDQANRLLVRTLERVMDQFDGANAQNLIPCLTYAIGYTERDRNF